jgi:hypothetical protein
LQNKGQENLRNLLLSQPLAPPLVISRKQPYGFREAAHVFHLVVSFLSSCQQNSQWNWFHLITTLYLSHNCFLLYAERFAEENVISLEK